MLRDAPELASALGHSLQTAAGIGSPENRTFSAASATSARTDRSSPRVKCAFCNSSRTVNRRPVADDSTPRGEPLSARGAVAGARRRTRSQWPSSRMGLVS